jgi:rod shape-determining protein MreC
VIFALLNRYREQLVIGVLLILPLANYLMVGHRGREPNFVDRSILALSSPIQAALTWVFSSVGGAADSYVRLRGAHDRALACKDALGQARYELNALREAEVANARLKGALKYTDKTATREILARIIGLNPSAQFQSIRIDRGDRDGLRVGMPVVTPEGVVGQVIRVVDASADIMLPTDPASRIGAVMQRSRVRGTVIGTGDGERLSLDLVLREDDPVDGEVVVTSGTDGVYPPGLELGTVKTIQRSIGLYVTGSIAPAVDLATAEYVLIIPVVLSAAAPAPATTSAVPGPGGAK